MRPLPCLLLAAAAACATACGGDPTSADAGPCGDLTTDVPDEPGVHIDEPTAPTWQTNPPASGQHWPRWGRWGVHDEVLARGHWVHNLEHGGVVFLYNCPAGCPELIDDLVGFTASLPGDPGCTPDIPARWILTADPLLPADVTVAASAWGWTYTASCFDDASLRRFYSAHVGHAPEDTCAQGSVPAATLPDAGPTVDGG